MADSDDSALTDTIAAGPADTTRASEPAGSHAAPGYQLGALLGRGGMGEVILAYDTKLEREVAIKRMRDDATSNDAVARFLREAKIQARLDHPAIVPVHEVGRDAEGRPYFTMKRLAGTTLAALLERSDSSLQRLLRALVGVCHAIDLAHARRIIHRDLKPANIMLGDYGEVYVLDWGIASILGEPQRPTPPVLPMLDVQTQAGQLLGTPGYMAPEQVRGDAVGPPSDIYAIGAILFEILAGESLHHRGIAALAATLAAEDLSPTQRRPERAIPPELEIICTAALASDPAIRPTARELADRLQSYLDGDRDLERRRDLARDHLDRARAALARGDRGEAIRAAGHALVFDPDVSGASDVLRSLITHVPDQLPPELDKAVEAVQHKAVRERSKRAIIPSLSLFIALPLVAVLEVRSWALLIGLYAAVTAIAVVSWVSWRHRLVPVWIWLSVQLIAVVMFSRLVGPFVLTPIVVCGILLSATSLPWLNTRRWAVVAWTATAAMLPFVLEWIGVFAPSWEVSAQGIWHHGTVFAVERTVAPFILIVANLAALSIVALYTFKVGGDRRRAQRALQVQAWNLTHLLPRTPLGA